MTPRRFHRKHSIHPHAAKPRHSGLPESVINAVGLKGLVKRDLCCLKDCLGLLVAWADGRQKALIDLHSEKCAERQTLIFTSDSTSTVNAEKSGFSKPGMPGVQEAA